MMLHTKYQGSMNCGFRQDYFLMFLHLFKPMKNMQSPGQAHFWPKGHNLIMLGRGLLDNATYQISRLLNLWFQTRRFLYVFPRLYKPM